MVKTLYSRQKRKKLKFYEEILFKLIKPLIIMSPSILGFVLVWCFLSSIDRTDVFQQIAFGNQATFMLFIVFCICMFSILYLSAIPSFMFVFFPKILISKYLPFGFSSKRPLIEQIIVLIIIHFFVILISIPAIYYSYIYTTLVVSALVYLFYSTVYFYLRYGKKLYIKLIFLNSLFAYISFLVITFLFLLIAGGKFESSNQSLLWGLLGIFLWLTLIYAILLIVFYLPAIIYCMFYNSYKIILSCIASLILVITFVLAIFYNNLFHNVFEKYLIIDRTPYVVFLNKNDFAKNIFNDPIWELKDLDEDSNFYLLRGEKFFNLSSYTLFCPLDTYKYFKSSPSKINFKDYTKHCRVLNIDEVMFEELKIGKLKRRVRHISKLKYFTR